VIFEFVVVGRDRSRDRLLARSVDADELCVEVCRWIRETAAGKTPSEAAPADGA
jgi:hypothetical protein